MTPPDGCTTSAVSPATLRTGAVRGAAGTSDAGDDGLGSSGLRHMGSSQPNLRSHRAGANAKQPEEDGRMRTIIYGHSVVYGLPLSKRVMFPIRYGRGQPQKRGSGRCSGT